MEIKIRDKSTGIIYSSNLSEKEHYITRIDFSIESTDFVVEDRIIDEDGEKTYKEKRLAIYDTSTLKNSIFAGFRKKDEAEWVNN